MSLTGVDGSGKVYNSPDEFWETICTQKKENKLHQRSDETKNSQSNVATWYSSAVEYWNRQEASTNGVLGGFGHVNTADIQDSRQFLMKAFLANLKEAREGGRRTVAADCGAGIGRVTSSLLLHFFDEVDLVEPSGHLLETARRNLVEIRPSAIPRGHVAGRFIQCGLEDFRPEKDRYDAIWVQWAFMYLTDEDAVEFLRRCASSLYPGGRIFLKENVCESGFIVDTDDCSITRSHTYNLELFKRAGLQVANTALQRNFPKHLFKVRMYALKI